MYWLIEPEISSSATIGGFFGCGPRYFRSISAPPAFMLARRVRRMSMRWPRGCGAQPARAHLVERQHQARDRVLGGGDLGRAHLREVLLLQHLAVGHGEARVELDLASRARAASRPENSASWTRCAPGGGGCGAPAVSGSIGAISFSMIAALAEEDAERLVEQNRVLVPLHEHRVQRPVEIVAGADAGRLHGCERVEHRARARPACPAARSARAK